MLLQLSVTWKGRDPESGIMKYEVGLGSSATSAEDLMQFTDTAGHRHLTTYHPNLHHNQKFYLHVKATNKAGLEATTVSKTFYDYCFHINEPEAAYTLIFVLV